MVSQRPFIRCRDRMITVSQKKERKENLTGPKDHYAVFLQGTKTNRYPCKGQPPTLGRYLHRYELQTAKLLMVKPVYGLAVEKSRRPLVSIGPQQCLLSCGPAEM